MAFESGRIDGAQPPGCWRHVTQRCGFLHDAPDGRVVAFEAGRVPVADVLDADVAAWSARRYAQRCAGSLPADAERGQRQVIWY